VTLTQMPGGIPDQHPQAWLISARRCCAVSGGVDSNATVWTTRWNCDPLRGDCCIDLHQQHGGPWFDEPRSGSFVVGPVLLIAFVADGCLAGVVMRDQTVLYLGHNFRFARVTSYGVATRFKRSMRCGRGGLFEDHERFDSVVGACGIERNTATSCNGGPHELARWNDVRLSLS